VCQGGQKQSKMKYECAFDFTICKPKKSEFIGKSGVIELTTDNPIPEENMEKFKNDQSFLANIAHHLATVHKQKNVFMVKVKSLTLIEG